MLADINGLGIDAELRPLFYIPLLREHYPDLAPHEETLCSSLKDGHKFVEIAKSFGVHKAQPGRWFKALRKRHPGIVKFLT